MPFPLLDALAGIALPSMTLRSLQEPSVGSRPRQRGLPMTCDRRLAWLSVLGFRPHSVQVAQQDARQPHPRSPLSHTRAALSDTRAGRCDTKDRLFGPPARLAQARDRRAE